MSDEAAKQDDPFQPLGRDLRRDDFTPERVRRIADAAISGGRLPLMSEEARRASLKAALDSIPAGADAWVFGYGSLMWNPAIEVAESKKAHVRGYHRMFCLTLHVGRGTVEQPGLMLGIDRGGSVTGVAHRIAAGAVQSELSILWMREMLTGVYEPRWVNADVEGKGRTRALTFVINRYHPRYEGALAEDAAAARIASAAGPLGTNRDYLYRTAQHLAELGIEDGPMHALEARVRGLVNEPR
ncbi:MAG TPA: gamma-glutamylcyclotransferase [Rhizomicrobium sp.]|jgi:cation transport protein ChaC|nr:gamma-glutamylcyclotransferase [Rhizomicrobium sp.]